jgi:nickel transport protein
MHLLTTTQQSQLPRRQFSQFPQHQFPQRLSFLALLATLSAASVGIVTGLTQQSAQAHSVQTDYLMSDKLEFTTQYSSGVPLQQANVRVFAPGHPDKPWFEGKTDANGKFSFKPDQKIPGEWEVRIGHGDHGDILEVPVTKNGVEVDKISSAIPSETKYGTSNVETWQFTVVGAIAAGGALGTSLLISRRSR